jgi:hypothetical protein
MFQAEHELSKWLERTPEDCTTCGLPLVLESSETSEGLFFRTWCDACAAPVETFAVLPA